MARKKSARALFEVVAPGGKNRNKPDLSVPDWMRTGQGAKPEGSEPQSSVIHRPDDEIVTPEAPLPQIDNEQEMYEQDRAIVSTEDGRITLSLNYVSCSVVALAIVLLLIVAFVAGRASVSSVVEKTPDRDNNAKRNGTEKAGIVPDNSASEFVTKPGKLYMIIQNTEGKTSTPKADAYEIAKYCSDVGYKAGVKTLKRTGSFLVLLQVPFDSKQEAQEYAVSINALGKRYANMYKEPYNFSQPYVKGKITPICVTAEQVENP